MLNFDILLLTFSFYLAEIPMLRQIRVLELAKIRQKIGL